MSYASQQDQTGFLSIPGWAISFALHAVLLLLFTASLKSCTSGTEGAGVGEMREIGIYMKNKNNFNQPETSDDNSQNNSDSNQSSSASAPMTGTQVSETVDPSPPLPLTSPQDEPSNIIGKGNPVPSFPQAKGAGTVTGNGNVKPKRSSRGGGQPGEASFLGLHDKGKSFIFLIDCSGSMANHSALRVAKSEVKTTLAGLESTQKFQILFFNERHYLLRIRNDQTNKLYLANDINRTLANQFINGIQANLGTKRITAIRRGLAMKPEVLFLLTDADNPLSARDLSEIKKLNKSKTRIHCIEFGKGSQLIRGNYLQRLAQQNKGSYGYRDVTNFDR